MSQIQESRNGRIRVGEIRVSPDRATLKAKFSDGSAFEIPAEALRVFSPSAEVQGHSESQRKLVPGKRNVRISRVSPVGNYAVRIAFDDGHDTGIYRWEFLFELGRDSQSRLAAYEEELAAAGFNRDSAFPATSRATPSESAPPSEPTLPATPRVASPESGGESKPKAESGGESESAPRPPPESGGESESEAESGGESEAESDSGSRS